MNSKKMKLYPILVLIATLFMGTCYAKIGNINLNVTGTLYAKSQEGLFITDVKYNSNIDADTSTSEIKSYYETMLNSNITLSEKNGLSTISYLVTFYNSYDHDYEYIETIYGEGFYDNTNITYEVISETNDYIIESKNYLTVKLTFKYVDGLTPPSDINKLSSCLNFKFEKHINYINYIESTGTQYINTKVVPNSKTTYEINFSMSDTETTNAIMGVRTADGVEPTYNLFLHNENQNEDIFKLRWDENDTRTYIDIPINEEKKITVTKNMDGVTFISNGHTSTIESQPETYEAAGELYLFNQNQLSTPETRYAKMKLYYFKIYQDGTLIRDFAPAFDDNNIACLYDKVTDSYYYSETTDDFISGDNSNYVDYIESSGTQYINTKIKPDSTTTVEFVMSLNEISDATESIFGSRNAMEENKYNIFIYQQKLRWDYYLSNVNPTYDKALTSPIFIQTKAESIIIGNTTTEYNYTDTFSVDYDMYLYAINTTGNTTVINKGMKIYYFKVIKNEEIVMNLIPKIDENGKACFYDLVSKEYFYNANDDSEFIAG